MFGHTRARSPNTERIDERYFYSIEIVNSLMETDGRGATTACMLFDDRVDGYEQ